MDVLASIQNEKFRVNEIQQALYVCFVLAVHAFILHTMGARTVCTTAAFRCNFPILYSICQQIFAFRPINKHIHMLSVIYADN